MFFLGLLVLKVNHPFLTLPKILINFGIPVLVKVCNLVFEESLHFLILLFVPLLNLSDFFDLKFFFDLLSIDSASFSKNILAFLGMRFHLLSHLLEL